MYYCVIDGDIHILNARDVMRLHMNKLGWAIHNMIGHPLMGILQLVGLQRAGTYVHDKTLPTKVDTAQPAVPTYGICVCGHGEDWHINDAAIGVPPPHRDRECLHSSITEESFPTSVVCRCLVYQERWTPAKEQR